MNVKGSRLAGPELFFHVVVSCGCSGAQSKESTGLRTGGTFDNPAEFLKQLKGAFICAVQFQRLIQVLQDVIHPRANRCIRLEP